MYYGCMSLTAEVLLMTAQSGGSFVFLKEDSADFSFFVSELMHALELKVPVVIRDAADIGHGLFRTRKEDLIFFMPSHMSQAKQWSEKLQGQRVLLKATEKPCSMDYYLAAADPKSEWKSLVQDVVEGLKHVKPFETVPSSHKSPCLFLDRDDVVVKNVPYNKDSTLVTLMPGIAELINQAHRKGYWVALVTNQSGLGRGLVNWSEYQQVHQKMLELLAKQGAWLDECVWAGYIENAANAVGNFLPSLRKPRLGMFQQVQEKLQADLATSVMIGDSASDLIAAYNVGLRKLYLLDAGKVAAEKEKLASYLTSYPDFKYTVLSELQAAQI
jgi:D-glycero-D-manno-heptose 1,7-bisphosphate phosphatase